MNKHILHKDVQDFITKNLNTEITKLVLKGSPFKEVSIQQIAKQITSKNKCKKKLPTWFNTKNIYYPDKLNIEQTSSEITAKYKSKLVKGENIIDLTGGFGVDCFAFSKTNKQVTHCEINESLSLKAKYNFQKLKIDNIITIIGNGIDYLKNNNKNFSTIYIDPSRRDSVKKRVFLLADCTPNLPDNLALLFNYSNIILVKTAPLLDVKAAINELGFVKEVHVVAVNNDVKEVLYLLEKDFNDEINYKTINFVKGGNQLFDFKIKSEEAGYSLPKSFLYEPNSAILKSGAFNEISALLKVDKLHKHSHLYTSDVLINFPGRIFSIIKVIKYNAKKIKAVLRIEKANITIRNFPETVAQIRKKTKLKDGGVNYLFFTTNIDEEKVVVVCKKA